MQFITKDSQYRLLPSGLVERRVLDNSGRSLTILIPKDPAALFDESEVRGLDAAARGGKVVLYCGYSSTIRKIVDIAPNATHSLGPFSAILDVTKLCEAVRLTAASRERIPSHLES